MSRLLFACLLLLPTIAVAGSKTGDSSKDEARGAEVPKAEEIPLAEEEPLSDDRRFGSLEQQGRFGVQVSGMTPELREHLGAPKDRGLLVQKVEVDSPAHQAGVMVGDVLLRVGERDIDSYRTLLQALQEYSGNAAEVQVSRKGKQRVLSAQLAEAPAWRRFFAVDPEELEELGERADSLLKHLEERGFGGFGPDLDKALEELEGRLDEEQIDELRKDLDKALGEMRKSWTPEERAKLRKEMDEVLGELGTDLDSLLESLDKDLHSWLENFDADKYREGLGKQLEEWKKQQEMLEKRREEARKKQEELRKKREQTEI